MGRILGIDLGTTNSCVAVVEGVAAQVLANAEGSRTTSSVVAFDEAGGRLVGQAARRQAITNPSRTIFGVKRLIGRKFRDPEIQAAAKTLPYTLIESDNGDVKVRIEDRDLSPEEVSALILREIKTFAEEQLGEEADRAVVTVPAYFSDAQRQATRDAGQLAGLEVLRIINEPTAAALAYGVRQPEGESRIVAVFDLGGGTFDISLLELAEGIFEVRATAGDTFLGGEDFDQRLIDWLADGFQEENGIDLRQDPMALQRLKEAAEAGKCELSTADSTAISLPFIAATDDGPLHLNRELGRSEFEGMVRDLVERTEGPCRDALESAGLRPDQVDVVLLVGGQTRMPLVAEVVEGIFGTPPSDAINPDEVVAMGAALQGGILNGDIKDIVLLDVTPLSLGVETHGGLFTRLIERNATIPTKSRQVFTTVVDNQDTVEIHVLQGERHLAAENLSLGRFDLVGITPSPRGVPQIEVTFAIDSNGIVNVSARDQATNQTQSVEIKPAGGLSPDEIKVLVQEAEEHAHTDQRQREVQKLKNRLEGLIYSADRVFGQFQNMLGDREREFIRDELVKSRTALGETDPDLVERAIENVTEVSQQLSQMMLNRSDNRST